MRLSSIILLVVVVIFFFSFFVPALIHIKRKDKEPAPFKISFWIIGALFLNWLLFLTDSYSLLPEHIADLIFVPIWWVLCFIGIIVGIVEFNNNRSIAIPIVGITIISFVFSLMANGMSKM